MKVEDILLRQPKVLSAEQRVSFFQNGYLVVERFIDESRQHSKSDSKFDLEPDRSADAPRLRRLSYPTAHHRCCWEIPASQGPIVDVAEDLLGPDVVFHHRSCV